MNYVHSKGIIVRVKKSAKLILIIDSKVLISISEHHHLTVLPTIYPIAVPLIASP